MGKASSNRFPWVTFAEQASDADTPPVGHQRLFVRDSDHVLCLIDEADAVTPLTGTLTDPTTTRGDLITRDASDLARLPIGTAKKVLMSDGTDPSWQYPTGVKWTAGTSMPGTPGTNDRVTRTDLSADFFYDGTRWLSVDEYVVPFAIPDSAATASLPFAASGSRFWAPVYGGSYDQWVTKIAVGLHVLTTNNGGAYWSLQVSDDAATNVGSATNSSALSAATWYQVDVAVGALIGTTIKALRITATKIGAPGNLYVVAAYHYRVVGT